MSVQAQAALFLLLGQTARREAQQHPGVVRAQPLLLAPRYDLSALVPESVARSGAAAKGYQLFFIFEEYLRDLVVDVLSKSGENWWDNVPPDVRQEVADLEAKEESKRWMAISARGKSALLTYPQLLKIVDDCWKSGFGALLRDKGLVQEARLLSHSRNTLCHMTAISDEEMERIRQVMRDWFRVVAP